MTPLFHEFDDIKPGTEITLTRRGQFVTISPIVKELILAIGSIDHELCKRSSAIVRVPSTLLWSGQSPKGEDCLWGYAGLEPLICRWLNAAGHAVVLRGRRPSKWGEPNLSELRDLGPIDGDFLSSIQNNDRGLFQCHRHRVRIDWLVAQVALAWPNAKIVIVSHKREPIDRLRSFLTSISISTTVFNGRNNPRRGSRVVIATPAYLRVGAIAIERRDLVMVLNPDLFVQDEKSRWAIEGMWVARLFGFLAEDQRLPESQRRSMNALFGERIVTIPRHGSRLRSVGYGFIKIVGGPELPPDLDVLELKGRGIWKHPVRNRRLARLARLVATGTQAELREHFSELPAMPLPISGRTVRVLVENVDHALALRGHLPTVPILVHPDVAIDAIVEADCKSILLGVDADWRKLPVAIVTATEATERLKADVLIRADGGPGSITLAPRVLRQSCEKADRTLFIVDCDDCHHPKLGKWSRCRRGWYESQGWSPAKDQMKERS